jgi:putative tryptophan/tyrosine transport system ATP-binding protein
MPFNKSQIYAESFMLQLKNISKTFHKNHPNEVKALDKVDLKIEKGTYLVVVGANGSGKSSLLNVVSGSFKPDEGDIYMGHQAITSLSDFRRSKWIARIFQNPLSGTAPDLSILDNFKIASLRTQKKGFGWGITSQFQKEVQTKIAMLEMGLENKIHQKMGTLSGGQRQALTLMMAIMDKAEILLMDEPTAALDPKSAKNLLLKAQKVIDEFQLTTILITHDLRDAHQYGNRIIQMEEGKISKDLGTEEKNTLSLNHLFEWFS